MERVKRYILLHLTVMLFSLTSVFSKAAAVFYNKRGLTSPWVYVFLFLMLLNCAVYAFAWQKAIKHFDLNVAYANRTVYMIWAQVWSVLIFHENLTAVNILGLVMVFIGVLVVIFHE